MDEERKVNMMSVDLALKREVAYRKKLARLYPEDECRNEVLPLEVKKLKPHVCLCLCLCLCLCCL